MVNNREELEKKILEAGSVEELESILKAAGAERTTEELAKLFEDIEARRENKKLSLAELEAVSGGWGSRYQEDGKGGPWGGIIDWSLHGCAATVEEGSDCWGTDGGCTMVNIKYYNIDYSEKCPAWDGPHRYDVVGRCEYCQKKRS